MNCKKRSLSYIFLLFTILLYTCSSTKLASTVSPEKTFNTILKKLQKGKVNEKNTTLLSNSISKIIEKIDSSKSVLQNNLNLKNQQKIFELNQSIVSKLELSKPYTNGIFSNQLAKLNEEQIILKDDLKTKFYIKGKEGITTAIKDHNKIKAKEAYYDLKKALEYEMETGDINTLLKESLEYSYINYNVLIKAPSNLSHTNRIVHAFKEIKSLNKKFKNIKYDAQDLNDIDCTIEFYFEPLSIYEDKKTEILQFQKEVATGRQNENGTIVTERVSATVNKNRTIKNARWDVKINTSSKYNNCEINSNFISKELKLESIDLEIRGDRRAVPDSYLNSDYPELPNDDEIVEALIEKIYKHVETKVF